MQRFFIFCSLICFVIAVSEKEAAEKFQGLWSSAEAGDANKYHSYLSPNVQVITNGDVDDAPWAKLSFVKELFSKVRYQNFVKESPVGLDKTGTTAFAHFSWDAVILATGEYIEMGHWSQELTFDSQGKITAINNICSNNALERLAESLQPMDNQRNLVEAFLAGWSAGDVDKMKSPLDNEFYMLRNSEEVENFFGKKALTALFGKTKWSLRLLSYAANGADTALASVDVSVHSTAGQSTKHIEGWTISFQWDKKRESIKSIGSIFSVMDSLALFDMDQLTK